VVGNFTEVNNAARTNLARLNPDGALDYSFLAPVGTSESVSCLALQGDGRVLVGGHWSPAGGALQKGLIRLLPDGSVDGSFTGSGFAGEVYGGSPTDGKPGCWSVQPVNGGTPWA
jgi:hypothetical protein